MTSPITSANLPVTALIFAKAPAPGLAKTRLIPALGAKGAADLAAQLLHRTVRAAREAEVGPVELCTTPATEHSLWRGIELPSELIVSEQSDGDLGARMAKACLRILNNAPAVLLMGTDCVEMSPELLKEAAAALQHHDAVLYPTNDGGYALLGLKHLAPNIFSDIPWSTSRVAALTQARIRQNDWTLYLGKTLQDIDQPEDLQWLLTDITLPNKTP